VMHSCRVFQIVTRLFKSELSLQAMKPSLHLAV